MNPEQYLLAVSMIIAAQAPVRQLHAAPLQTNPVASIALKSVVRDSRFEGHCSTAVVPMRPKNHQLQLTARRE